MKFVLDASVALAWCFEDTANPAAERALDALAAGGEAVVPPLWRLEMANVLVIAERRKRLTEADTARFLGLLESLPIQAAPDRGGTAAIVALARAHGLTAYDTAYLDLAQRTGLPLATLDGQLAEAARAAGVTVMTGGA
ncbi:MAG: type II toxin-antitoxin system VapC family toxin [Magnetospirillum sp.]|nr:type II toxin-antitoxin system VapC family toxin [Magnetospirillum sp.]